MTPEVQPARQAEPAAAAAVQAAAGSARRGALRVEQPGQQVVLPAASQSSPKVRVVCRWAAARVGPPSAVREPRPWAQVQSLGRQA